MNTNLDRKKANSEIAVIHFYAVKNHVMFGVIRYILWKTLNSWLIIDHLSVLASLIAILTFYWTAKNDSSQYQQRRKEGATCHDVLALNSFIILCTIHLTLIFDFHLCWLAQMSLILRIWCISHNVGFTIQLCGSVQLNQPQWKAIQTSKHAKSTRLIIKVDDWKT